MNWVHGSDSWTLTTSKEKPNSTANTQGGGGRNQTIRYPSNLACSLCLKSTSVKIEQITQRTVFIIHLCGQVGCVLKVLVTEILPQLRKIFFCTSYILNELVDKCNPLQLCKTVAFFFFLTLTQHIDNISCLHLRQ